MKTILKAGNTDETILRYWRLSLALGVAVIGAVALLLEILVRTAESIEAGAASIWEVGKNIANNTVHIPLLVRTNQMIAQISAAADGIAGAATRIKQVAAPNGTEPKGTKESAS